MNPNTQHEKQPTFHGYLMGFILSVGFTLWAYVSVVYHSFNGHVLLAWLLGLAVAQFMVQLVYFLHVGAETKPRWKRLTILLMIFFVLVVVLGSIWIMYNLNYRMSPKQMEQYMSQQAGSGF